EVKSPEYSPPFGGKVLCIEGQAENIGIPVIGIADPAAHVEQVVVTDVLARQIVGVDPIAKKFVIGAHAKTKVARAGGNDLPGIADQVLIERARAAVGGQFEMNGLL